MAKTIFKSILKRVVGFLIFLLVLWVFNFLASYIGIGIYLDIVEFFNNAVLILFILMCFGILSDIFWIIEFPITLVAPIFSSIYTVYLLMFFYRVWLFVENYVQTGIVVPMNRIYFLVSVIVLCSGYLIILFRQGREIQEGVGEEEPVVRVEKKKEEPERDMINWGDVGHEFRVIFYNIGRNINSLFERKKDKQKDNLRQQRKKKRKKKRN